MCLSIVLVKAKTTNLISHFYFRSMNSSRQIAMIFGTNGLLIGWLNREKKKLYRDKDEITQYWNDSIVEEE